MACLEWFCQKVVNDILNVLGTIVLLEAKMAAKTEVKMEVEAEVEMLRHVPGHLRLKVLSASPVLGPETN